MSGSPRALDPWAIVTALGYLVVAVLLAWPLLDIARASFTDASGPSLAHYREVLGAPYYRDAIRNSLLVALGSALGAVLLGVPLAVLTARYRIPGARVVGGLAALALLSPPFIGAYAWIVLLGQAGWLREALAAATGLDVPTIYGPWGIVLVHALELYPFVYLLTAGALSTVDRSLEEAAASLGASPTRALLGVTLPLVLPAVSAGALVAFVLALSSFGTPLLLGRGFRVLPTEAYRLFTSELGADPGRAAAVSVVLVALSCLALAAQRALAARRKVSSVLLRRPALATLRGWRLALATATCHGVVALSTLPLLVVAVASVREGPGGRRGLGLESYAHVLRSVPRALGNSLTYGLCAVLLIVVLGALLGYVVARRRGPATRLLDALLMVPYVVPGTVLGIGFVVAWNRLPLPLVGTGAVLVLAAFIRRLPHMVRSSAAILAQVDPALEEAATSLGATPARAFAQVTLPLMGPGLLAGGVLAFVTAINEVSAAMVLYVGATITVPVRIYLSVQDGSYGPAAALSTILLAVTALAVLVAWRAVGEAEVAGA